LQYVTRNPERWDPVEIYEQEGRYTLEEDGPGAKVIRSWLGATHKLNEKRVVLDLTQIELRTLRLDNLTSCPASSQRVSMETVTMIIDTGAGRNDDGGPRSASARAI
jgi:hypothetical protein